MRSLAYSLALLALVLGGLAAAEAQAPAVGVGFRNYLKMPVLVQGWSLVNNMQRRGQPFLVQPGRIVWENNAPAGTRYYTVHDATQTSRIMLRDRPVQIRGTDQFFGIRPLPGDASRVVLSPEPVPPQ